MGTALHLNRRGDNHLVDVVGISPDEFGVRFIIWDSSQNRAFPLWTHDLRRAMTCAGTLLGPGHTRAWWSPSFQILDTGQKLIHALVEPTPCTLVEWPVRRDRRRGASGSALTATT